MAADAVRAHRMRHLIQGLTTALDIHQEEHLAIEQHEGVDLISNSIASPTEASETVRRARGRPGGRMLYQTMDLLLGDACG